jgi:hypothetical protein
MRRRRLVPKDEPENVQKPDDAEALKRALEGAGIGRLVSAVESLRPGTRLLTDGQKTVLVEYRHIVDELSSPTFSPPAPVIAEFRSDNGRLRIYGKHLRQPIAITVAGARATQFQFKEADEVEGDEAPHIEADVPPEAGTGPIIVLTSGGTATSAVEFQAADADGVGQIAAAPPDA